MNSREIKVGMRFADRDKRTSGRVLTVIEVVADTAKTPGRAVCTVMDAAKGPLPNTRVSLVGLVERYRLIDTAPESALDAPPAFPAEVLEAARAAFPAAAPQAPRKRRMPRGG